MGLGSVAWGARGSWLQLSPVVTQLLASLPSLADSLKSTWGSIYSKGTHASNGDSCLLCTNLVVKYLLPPLDWDTLNTPTWV